MAGDMDPHRTSDFIAFLGECEHVAKFSLCQESGVPILSCLHLCRGLLALVPISFPEG